MTHDIVGFDPFARLGRIQIGLGMAGFGLLHLARADFVTRMVSPVPDWFPARSAAALALGAGLAVAGVAIVVGRAGARRAALAIGALTAFAMVTLYLPMAFARPAVGAVWTRPAKYLAFGAGVLFLAALLDSRCDARAAARRRTAERAARIGLATFLLLGGLQHFAYLEFVANMVPAWFPERRLWAAFAGVALLAGGAGLLLPRTTRLAARLSGAMILSWFFLVHVPRVVASPADAGEWSGLFESLAISGVAFALSDPRREA